MEPDTLEPQAPETSGRYQDYGPVPRSRPFESGSVVMPDHNPRRPSYTDQVDVWHVLRRIMTLLLFCIGVSATVTFILSRQGKELFGLQGGEVREDSKPLVVAKEAPVVVPDFRIEPRVKKEETATKVQDASASGAPLEHVLGQPVKIEARRYLYASGTQREFGTSFSAESRNVDMKMDRSVELTAVPGNSGRYTDKAGGLEWQGGFSLENADKNLRLGRSYTEYLNSMSGALPGGNLNVASDGNKKKVLPSVKTLNAGSPKR
ncbi:MAG: hypothetical protein QY326_07000 [Bdellovibrionota bacterium]|nr:MAG: hypothetical protein QY326_07000 [Bdellovibrionota bacterium]